MPTSIKVSQLTADANPTYDDLMYLVNDPGGTPASRSATLEALFSLLFTKRTIASNDAAVAGDDIIFINTASGSITLTLLTAADRTRPLRVKNIGSAGNDATIDAAGTETIDGALTYILGDGDSVTLYPRTTTAWESLK